MVANFPGQSRRSCGQASQVAACGSHSAGMRYPSAIGWHPDEKQAHGEAQVAAWQTMHRAHAIANGVYVAAVNRVGHEGAAGGGIEFWGASFVSDPFGVLLQEASRVDEALVVVECDRGHQEDIRRNWPFLRDRRIDAYAPITKRLLDE